MPYIGRGSDFGVRSRFIYTATAGQTSFSGNDDAGISLAYTDTLYMDVYQNGVLLVPATDYAASTGTSVVLVQGASVDDTLELLVHDIFSVADSVSAKDGGSFAGNVGMGGTLSVTGKITADAGIDIDNFNIDGNTIALSSGHINLDSAGQIFLDSADDGNIQLRTSGTQYGAMYSTSSDWYFKSIVSDKDIKFQGVDGGSQITALTLDMSDAGAATFNNGISLSDGNLTVAAGHGIDFSNQASPTGGMTSELMDRYEEGTFTPTVASDAGPAGYTTQNGFYTRIGRVVYISALVQVSDMGSFSGATVQLGGLPFTVANLSNYEPVGICVLDGAANAKSNIFLRFIANNNYARLETNNGATDHDNNMNANAFDTGTILKASGTYFTAT